jgi:PAS domain S-box-containing protein
MSSGEAKSSRPDARADEPERRTQYFESLLEISPVAIVMADLDGLVTAWNPSAEELFGYSEREALGRPIDELIATSDDLREEAAAVKAEASRTGRVHSISRRARKDGSLVDVDVLAVSFEVDGTPAGYYAIYHDISELQRQRRYYESLLESSPSAIVTVALDHTVTSWNPGAERLFGYTREEAIGMNIDHLVANRDDLFEEAEAISRRIAATHAVTRRTRKDGSLVDVDLVGSPIVVGGEIVGLYVIYNDISELQRQKRYYESLLELSLTAIATVDRDSNVTTWNPAAERLFGYSAAEAIGRNIDDLVATDARLRDEAIAVSDQNREAGEEIQLVTRRTRKDGSLVDVQVLAAPIVIGGEHVGQYALYHDISELQRQRRYYEALFELSPAAIATVDPDVNVTSWNAAAERLFGYSRDEAVGKNLNDLVAHTSELRSEGVELDRETQQGEVRRTTRRMRKDGSFVDVDLRAAPMIVGGEPIGMFCLYNDITELQRQRRYFESLFDLNPIAVVAFDADEKVTAWNPAAERLFGYTAAEAIGRDIDDLVAGDERIRPGARELNQRALRDDQVDVVTQRTRKDGTLVDVHLLGCGIVVGGEQVGRYALYHDIGELQRARREAEAATAAKSAFLATMSHEIRTPMNAVIGMTELLLGTALDAEQRSFAEVIRTSGEALLSVINDILDFSKIEAGRLDLEQQALDLRECVESALELVSPLAAEKGLDLAYLLDPQVPEAIVGDVARLRQILLNLLNNAIKFTETGEVVLRVEATPSFGDDRYVIHFALSDTGIGISEERMHTLFESFTQADTSTTRRFGGTGLGLAISRRLAEAMGGRIWAESRTGEGSTFHFTIDAAAAPRPVRSYESPPPAALDSKRVLILDDNATNRQILQAYVQSWGMIPRDTASPTEALEWVRRGDPFDVAILDMQMPELDGFAVAREIRRHRAEDRLPLILLTSLGRREAADEVRFAAQLTKPIRPSQLYDTLLDVLGEGAASATPTEPAAPVRTGAAALRVLVAEDNPVNQRIALLLLERLGHRASVATNGVEALDALERERYDVVLMDVQMPEMDGLEATRRIHERWRRRERPRIIAVTAGAMSEERERCLAAGMDDYLSKPIRLEELAAALGEVLPQSDQTLDAAALTRLRETVGDDSAVEHLVRLFLAESEKLIRTMHAAVRDGNAVDLRRAAHTLRSNAATFGAATLEQASRALESLAARGIVDGAEDLVGRIASAYEQARDVLGDHEREQVR